MGARQEVVGSMTDIREAFEHWFSDEGKYPRAVERYSDGHYMLKHAQDAWKVWQAAWDVATKAAFLEAAKQAGEK